MPNASDNHNHGNPPPRNFPFPAAVRQLLRCAAKVGVEPNGWVTSRVFAEDCEGQRPPLQRSLHMEGHDTTRIPIRSITSLIVANQPYEPAQARTEIQDPRQALEQRAS